MLALTLIGLTGCVDYNNRPPASAAEIKTADAKRQSYVDTLPNLTPEQKAQMKSHLGGPPAPPAPGMPSSTGRPDAKMAGR
ncbi:MAG: hypothetical protein ACYC96_04300 [Fimbriimonadaceae bacterium]